MSCGDFHRSLETEEEDAIFKDPLAHIFAGAQALNYGRTLTKSEPEKTRQILVGPTCVLGQVTCSQGLDHTLTALQGPTVPIILSMVRLFVECISCRQAELDGKHLRPPT